MTAFRQVLCGWFVYSLLCSQVALSDRQHLVSEDVLLQNPDELVGRDGALGGRLINQDFEDDKTPLFLIKQNVSWPSKSVLGKLGQITAVSVDVKDPNNILVLHRADRVWDDNSFDERNMLQDQVSGLIKNATLGRVVNGRLTSTYLDNMLSLPHGLSVDAHGNVWITDVGLHQVMKFGPDQLEKPLLVLGEKYVPGSDDNHFCKPTHVQAASNGDFFVADGYCNNRIMKFNEKGKIITYWGQSRQSNTFPDPYELDVPHQLTLIEQDDMICVADRENWRVVCYSAGLRPETSDNAGEYLFQLDVDGPAYGVAYAPHERLLLVLIGPTDGEDDEGVTPGVRIFDLSTKGSVQEIENIDENFRVPHSLATCPSANQPGCFIVSSSEPPEEERPNEDLSERPAADDSRRLWLYQFARSARGLKAM